MGESGKKNLEKTVRKRARRRAIENALIATLAVAGTLTVAAAAPKVLSLLKHIDPDWIPPRDPKQRLRETMYRLRRKGLVKFGHGSTAREGRPVLTEAGKQKAALLQAGTFGIKKPLRWDRRWRMVVFDIPHEQRLLRDKVRRLLQNLGFLRLQNSVWVHPYDCEEIIALLKTHMRIGKNVLYVIADAIEFDKPLREHFDLPLD